jgi:hypothetical protein
MIKIHVHHYFPLAMLLHWKLALYHSPIPQNKAPNKYQDLFLSTYLQKRLGYSKKERKKEKKER